MATNGSDDSSSNISVRSVRSEEVRPNEPPAGMGTEETGREKTNRSEHSCQCEGPGYCDSRKCKVNILLWKKCQGGGYEAVSKLLEGSKKEFIPTKPTVVKKNKSTIGRELLVIIEKEIGYTIQCGSCLEYFDSITSSDTHEKLVSELYWKAPQPDWWRIKYRNKQARLDRYSELIDPVVPKHSNPRIPKPLIPIQPVKDSDWYVAVTTAPRKDPQLSKCLDSIYRCGWEPTVFAEPESVVVEGYNYVHNSERLGAFHNWLKTMHAALGTDAKYILSVQDDSLFHPDSRKLVEQLMWPTNKVGFISLYTAKHYSQNLSGEMKPIGLNRLITSSLWGACALVFPRDVVRQILDHPLTQNWTGIAPKGLTDRQKLDLIKEKKEKPYLIQNVDTLIGQVLNGIGLEMWCIDPSPVQHIAVYSSIGHADSNTGKRNCLRCADHKKPLDLQVFPK